MGKKWWSRRKCPHDGTLMAAEHGKKGKFLLICPTCWEEMESSSPFGDDISLGQDGIK